MTRLIRLRNSWRQKMSKYLANQKLWKIIKEPTGYYYEIRLAGTVIDRIKIEEPTLNYFKSEDMI